MAVKVTPEELASKWGTRLKGSIDDIRRGVERVEVAPGKLAAAKADKWQSRLSAAETKAKWSRRVAAMSLEEWKARFASKGLSRIASGVDASLDKMTRFAAQLIAHQNAGLSKIEALPDLTLEDSINRMGAWVRHMAQFQLKD